MRFLSLPILAISILVFAGCEPQQVRTQPTQIPYQSTELSQKADGAIKLEGLTAAVIPIYPEIKSGRVETAFSSSLRWLKFPFEPNSYCYYTVSEYEVPSTNIVDFNLIINNETDRPLKFAGAVVGIAVGNEVKTADQRIYADLSSMAATKGQTTLRIRGIPIPVLNRSDAVRFGIYEAKWGEQKIDLIWTLEAKVKERTLSGRDSFYEWKADADEVHFRPMTAQGNAARLNAVRQMLAAPATLPVEFEAAVTNLLNPKAVSPADLIQQQLMMLPR